MMRNQTSAQKRCATNGTRAWRRALFAAAVVLGGASSAHAEAGSRICGVWSFSQSYPRENVGFIMKVNKGDNTTCQNAISRALQKFNAVGGTTSIKGLNRIWRRVRGGSDGPFSGKSVASGSFSQTTCETFTSNVSGRSGDFCVGMPRNQMMAFAATNSGEFKRIND